MNVSKSISNFDPCMSISYFANYSGHRSRLTAIVLIDLFTLEVALKIRSARNNRGFKLEDAAATGQQVYRETLYIIRGK